MAVVSAIKRSIETSSSPGLSVNAHPNHFFLNVNGAIDLRRAAELAIEHLDAYEAHIKAKTEVEIKRALAEAEKLITHGPAPAQTGASNDTSATAMIGVLTANQKP